MMQRVETILSHVGHRRYCHLERVGDAAILLLHHEVFNTLTPSMRGAIQHYFTEAEADPAVRCIILAGEGNAFSCGVDITDFRASASQMNYDGGAIPSLASLANMLENSSKIVVAAIHGIAYSGGLELALAAHYRVAAPTAEFSFPEVQLGIVPCGGGTQRLPRLIGVQAALRMIVTSKKMTAGEALDVGLVDHVTSSCKEGEIKKENNKNMRESHTEENENISNAVEKLPSNDNILIVALQLSAGWKNPRRISRDNTKLGNFLVNRFLFQLMMREIEKNVPKGVRAPFRCLEAVRAATVATSFEEGLKEEMKLFLQAMASPEACAMQYLLQSSNAVFRGSLASLPHGISGGLNIRRFAVIGCGAIGSGVTLLILRSRIPVTVVELNEERCLRARLFLKGELNREVENGRVLPQVRDQRLSMVKIVTYDMDLVEALRDVDMVVECVSENIALKKQIFHRLSDVCPPHCIFATSASSVSTGELAKMTRRPEKVIGMHFIPPSYVTPLLEIVQAPYTDQATILQAICVGRLFRKAVIITKDIGACLTTRLFSAGLRQAFSMLEEGAFPIEVDHALRRFGFRVGVFAMEDLVGLDFTAKVRSTLHQQTKSPFTEADVYTIPRLLVEEGRLGQKTGLGWYNYEERTSFRFPLSVFFGNNKSVDDSNGATSWGVWRKGGATLRLKPRPDRDVELLILDVCRKKDILRRDISEKEIIERIIFSIINEAARLLVESAVVSSAAVDVAMTFGYGFPAWRGGVCYYADKFGLTNVVHRMRIYNRAFGDAVFPPPCDALLQMVASQQTFHSMWQ